MAEQAINNPPSSKIEFEDDDNDDLFVSAIGNKKDPQQSTLTRELNNIDLNEPNHQRSGEKIENTNSNDDDDNEDLFASANKKDQQDTLTRDLINETNTNKRPAAIEDINLNDDDEKNRIKLAQIHRPSIVKTAIQSRIH